MVVSSVASIKKLLNCAENIRNTVKTGKKVIAVVSAMGKQTDDLLGLAHEITKKPAQRELDILLSAGERITMALLGIALNDMNIPSISLTGSQVGIITDTQHGNAKIEKILGDRVRAAFLDLPVVIVAGFQGVSSHKKDITTLGRGGSDLTAIALAKEFNASLCQLYKDVEGICTADPRVVTNTQVIEKLSYKSLCQLTWQGSGVIHSRGSHLANKFKIPLELRSSIKLNIAGTKIGDYKAVESAVVHAISHQRNLTEIVIKNSKLSDIQKFLWSHNLQALILSEKKTSEIHTICSMDAYDSLKNDYEVSLYRKDIASISIVGEGFWQEFEIIQTIENELKAFDVYLVESKNDLINIVLSERHLNEAINTIHAALFK